MLHPTNASICVLAVPIENLPHQPRKVSALSLEATLGRIGVTWKLSLFNIFWWPLHAAQGCPVKLPLAGKWLLPKTAKKKEKKERVTRIVCTAN